MTEPEGAGDRFVVNLNQRRHLRFTGTLKDLYVSTGIAIPRLREIIDGDPMTDDEDTAVWNWLDWADPQRVTMDNSEYELMRGDPAGDGARGT